MDRDKPLCEGPPWYMGQWGGAAAVRLADAVEDGAAAGGVEGGAGLADPEQPAAARASRTIDAPARRLTARPRARCSTSHLYHRSRERLRSLADGHSCPRGSCSPLTYRRLRGLRSDTAGASAVPGLLWGAAGKGERRDPGDRGDRAGGLTPDGTAGGRGGGGHRGG